MEWRAERELEIEQTVASQDLDTVLLVETKLRTEARKKIKIEGYKAFERRRSDADEDKKGGGICILTRTKGGQDFRAYNPDIPEPSLQYVNKERIWVTYDSARGRTAIGLVCTVEGQESH